MSDEQQARLSKPEQDCIEFILGGLHFDRIHRYYQTMGEPKIIHTSTHIRSGIPDIAELRDEARYVLTNAMLSEGPHLEGVTIHGLGEFEAYTEFGCWHLRFVIASYCGEIGDQSLDDEEPMPTGLGE